MKVYGISGLTERKQAYLLLEKAAQIECGLTGLPEIRRTIYGKPYFPGECRKAFNLSHSGELALCALDEEPVGIDIQMVKEWRPSLPGRVCSNQELEWLKRQSEFWGSFCFLWALKESRVKCTGTGLRDRISEIRVPLPRENETLYQLDGMWFRIYQGTGWCGAACGFSIPPENICWLNGQEDEIPPLQRREILL